MRAFFCDGDAMSGSSAVTRLRGCEADCALAPSAAQSNILHLDPSSLRSDRAMKHAVVRCNMLHRCNMRHWVQLKHVCTIVARSGHRAQAGMGACAAR